MHPANINTLDNNNSNPPDNFDCLKLITSIWQSIPLFVKSVIIITFVLYIIDFILPIVGYYLASIPYETIIHIQIWRLFTSVFLSTSIFDILFSLVIWVRDAEKLESQNGTLKYMFIFTINTIMVQMIYCLLCLILGLILGQTGKKMFFSPSESYYVQNSGLWPLVMAEMTILCLSNSKTPMRILFFPCTIKAKYYPFVLFLFFSLLSGFQIQPDIFAGILYGILHHFVIKDRLHLKDTCIQKYENCIPFKFLKKFNNYVSINSSTPVTINNTTSNRSSTTLSSDTRNFSQNAPTQPSSDFSAFKGKGIAVGGSLGLTKDDYQGISQSNESQV